MRTRIAIVLALLAFAAMLAGAAFGASSPDSGTSSPANPGPARAGRLVLHHGGMTILWPIRGQRATRSAGARIAVTVFRSEFGDPRRPARIALVRVDKRGRERETVGSATLRDGTFALRLPAGAGTRYVLRIAIGRWQRQAVVHTRLDCFAHPPSKGTTSGTLTLDRTSAHPGDTVVSTLANTGTTCLVLGLAYGWERQAAGGDWEAVAPPADLAFLDIGLIVEPGASRPEEERVWEQMPPGTYRLVKDVSGGEGGSDGGSRQLTLSSGPLVVTAR